MRRVAVPVAVAFLFIFLFSLGSNSNVMAQSRADFQMGVSPLQPGCIPGLAESAFDAQTRCERENAANQAIYAEQARERERLRQESLANIAELQKRPPLPAAQNRLLGAWQAPRRAASPTIAGDELSTLLLGMISGGVCGVMFNGDRIEFTADRWISTGASGRTDLGPVGYRALADGVAVLPAQGIQIMMFEVISPDQIRLAQGGDNCVLNRIGPAQAATAPGSTRAATPDGQASNPAPARTAQSAAARSVPVLTWDDDRTGYQCPNGVQMLVFRCIGPNPGDGCQAQEWGLPGYGERGALTAYPRGNLAAQLASCQPSKVTLDAQGRMSFPR
jgi:hypothetical protein